MGFHSVEPKCFAPMCTQILFELMPVLNCWPRAEHWHVGFLCLPNICLDLSLAGIQIDPGLGVPTLDIFKGPQFDPHDFSLKGQIFNPFRVKVRFGS